MLTATLTSFSGELGLVSSFCLNKMFDTVSDFFFFLLPLGCALAFPLSSCLGEGAGLSINFPAFFSGCTLSCCCAVFLGAGTHLGVKSTVLCTKDFAAI